MPINREVNNTLSTDATTRRRLFANSWQRVSFFVGFFFARRDEKFVVNCFSRVSSAFRAFSSPRRSRASPTRGGASHGRVVAWHAFFVFLKPDCSRLTVSRFAVADFAPAQVGG